MFKSKNIYGKFRPLKTSQNKLKSYFLCYILCCCFMHQRVKRSHPVWRVSLHYQSLAEESFSYHPVTCILTHQLTQLTHCSLAVAIKPLVNYSCLVSVTTIFSCGCSERKKRHNSRNLVSKQRQHLSNEAVFSKFVICRPPAQAGKCHHHRCVVTSPLQHGEGAANL